MKRNVLIGLVLLACFACMPYRLSIEQSVVKADVVSTSIKGHILIAGETKIDLTQRAVLYVMASESSRAVLDNCRLIDKARRPYVLVKVPNDFSEASLSELMKDLDYSICSEQNTAFPSIVLYGGDGLTGYMYNAVDTYLEKLRYPLLIGQAQLLNPQISNGNNNAKQAAQQINETVVEPGKTFAFYDYVQPSIENGYQDGLTLYTTSAGAQWLPDIGGGICKTATVLNFAVEAAGLPVTERHMHTAQVSYATSEQDTSVTRSGGWDYCFVNNHEKPIRIKCYQNGSYLVVEIYEELPETEATIE